LIIGIYPAGRCRPSDLPDYVVVVGPGDCPWWH